MKDLETVIPHGIGATVLVVGGPHRFKRGKLRERDSKRGTAVVQLMGDSEVHQFAYEHISEYVGPEYNEDF
jgi:hypothetical protein